MVPFFAFTNGTNTEFRFYISGRWGVLCRRYLHTFLPSSFCLRVAVQACNGSRSLSQCLLRPMQERNLPKSFSRAGKRQSSLGSPPIWRDGILARADRSRSMRSRSRPLKLPIRKLPAMRTRPHNFPPTRIPPRTLTDVPRGGCMPFGITGKGELVFPMECQAILTQYGAGRKAPQPDPDGSTPAPKPTETQAEPAEHSEVAEPAAKQEASRRVEPNPDANTD